MNKHLATGLLAACFLTPAIAQAQGADGTLSELARLMDHVRLARRISEPVLHRALRRPIARSLGRS